MWKYNYDYLCHSSTSHKYIRKYQGSKGNTVYIYNRDHKSKGYSRPNTFSSELEKVETEGTDSNKKALDRVNAYVEFYKKQIDEYQKRKKKILSGFETVIPEKVDEAYELSHLIVEAQRNLKMYENIKKKLESNKKESKKDNFNRSIELNKKVNDWRR